MYLLDKALPLLLGLLCICICVGPALAAETLKSWTISDSIGHDWQNELVFLAIGDECSARPGQEPRYAVCDSEGTPIPFQFWQRECPAGSELCLALLIDLPANSSRTFTLTRAKNQAKNPADLKVEKHRDNLVISAGRTAVRLAAPRKIKPGVPFSRLPAPIQTVKGVSGAWLGEGSLSGSFPVMNYSVAIEASGPLFAQVKYRYTFGPRQFYQVRLRMISGEDVILVEEDFALSEEELAKTSFVRPPDLAPEIGTPSHYNDWLLNKGIGWNDIPTNVQQYPCFRFNFTKGMSDPRARGYGIGQAKPSYAKADLAAANDDWRLGLVLTPYQERGKRGAVIGFEDTGGKDYLGIFQRFGSRWEHPNENRVLLPWLEEGIVGHFLAFEGRREWGIMADETGPQHDEALAKSSGSTFAALQGIQAKHGELPLEKVKDWVLAWEQPRDTYYPRLYYTPDSLARMQEQFPGLPGDIKELIQQDQPAHAFLTGDQVGMRRAFDSWKGLQQSVDDFFAGGNNTMNTYTHRFQEIVRSNGRRVDIGLASPDLTAEERRKALAAVAFLAYRLADQDYWSYRAYGGGPSNPNMMSISTHALATMAMLAYGHPCRQDWLKLCERLVCADITTSIGPKGAWLESPGYQGAGNTPINETVLILQNAGVANLAADPVYGERLLSVATYFANLLTPPDPRFENKRMPMALGDNTPFWATHYTYLANSGKEAFPDHAGHALWCWQQMGRPVGDVGLMLLQEHVLDQSISPKSISGKSTAFPGFGVMLRHGFGTEYETFMTYRQNDFGYGHYDEDQGSFSLFAKGAPLCLDWIDYSPNEAEYHNRVVYENDVPWLAPPPDAFVMGEEADYVRSHEGKREDGQPKWTRQFVLVKDTADPGDATYLVFRDVVQTEQPSTWNVWALAKKGSERIDGNIARLEGQFGIDLTLFFTRKPDKPLASTFHHHRTRSYITMDQDQTRIQAAGDQGGDYTVVLYPLRRGMDTEPVVRELPGGVTEINWGNGRRHLLFLFPDVREVNEGGLAFTGRAAVAKYDGNAVTLVPLECERFVKQ